MNNQQRLGVTLAGMALLLGASGAHAALSSSYQFNGKGDWSVDGCGGSASNPVCTINAVVPTGSTIEQAFLYSTMNTTNVVPTVNFAGTVYSGASWTSLGQNIFLEAYRADVTAQIAAAVGGGSAVPFNFSVVSETPNGSIDGEVLAIVYSNPASEERTIAFLDGFSASTGDATSINLAEALTAAQLADPAFSAALSLGIGFGFQPSNQQSDVRVNGVLLTDCAGGQDDGESTNGGLITVGGLGDDPSNNQDCTSSDPRADDELYDLVPFLTAGDTQIQIDTLNPSQDDNIFFAGINITAEAGVNQPPPSVPAPGSVALFGLGLLGLRFSRRRNAANA